jgi:hypothetical protein
MDAGPDRGGVLISILTEAVLLDAGRNGLRTSRFVGTFTTAEHGERR